jgi:hypothetical protein
MGPRETQFFLLKYKKSKWTQGAGLKAKEVMN